MKPITKKDLLNNRFIKFTNPERTRFKVRYPSKYLVESWHLKTICILAGVNALKNIDLIRAEKIANYYLNNKTKEEIIRLLYNE